jgi:FkbM family methyltransferase
VALLNSIPNVIKRRSIFWDSAISEFIKRICQNTVVELYGLKYGLLDFQSLEIISPEFENFFWSWLKFTSNEVFVDVGAHIGKYTLVAAKLVGERGKVIAIEPHPLYYRVLQENVMLNNLRNVVTFNLAAWHKKDDLALFEGDATGQHSVKTNFSKGFTIVRAEAMDNIVEILNLPSVDWVKIDVEGSEYEVVRGLQRTLSKHKPKIIVEVYPLNFQKNLPNVKEYMRNYGYDLIKISPHDYFCVPIETY